MSDNQGMNFDAAPVKQDTPVQDSTGMTFDAAPVKQDTPISQQSQPPAETGITRNEDGSFVITPKEGESFSDTMRRAAEAGKHVTPEMIQSQTRKGLREAPAVLAAAPVIGAAGAAGLAAPGEIVAGVRAIPGVTEALLQHAETKAAEWAAQYPNLIGVAKALGIPASTAGVLGWLYHNSKGK